jgi:thioredoxin 1
MVEIKTVEEFDNIISNNNIVVVKFGAEWCGPCKTFHTVLKSLEQTLIDENTKGDIICGVDVEEVAELTNKFHIKNVPTTLIFKGGEIVDKLIGTQSESKLKEKIDKLI